jgi:hypothetical protein
LLPPAWRAALDRFFHVLSGTEGAASPSEHGHFKLVIIPKFTPGRGQAGAQIMAERVKPLWPIHADHHYLSVTLGLDESHGSTSFIYTAQGQRTRRVSRSKSVLFPLRLTPGNI